MTAHRPVMLDEALAGLALRPDGTYLDGTFGRGGHSSAILAALGPAGRLLALDQDPAAVAHARERLGTDARFAIAHRNFSEMTAVAAEAGLVGRIDGLLLDLGVSSPQLDEAARGFSFGKDGPLDMRMNPEAGEPASAWLARAAEEEIADVLWRYGDERNSRRIARRIVSVRAETPLLRTAQLAELIAGVPGPRSHGIHPATRSFQAIRIHINRELAVLEAALSQAVDLLAPGGRLAVISFHSLEDRIVKRFIRDASQTSADGEVLNPTLRRIAKQFPSPAECSANPRARSAVLRVAEKRA
ncbi:MAG TPA: 16S rRNA (cytosine(1402)-N(4))-methyltransferase RsmH [Solimonas sp.]|nr:16S rRNA (cytosine(1402)-N(4))-methyltransferase RsmH [Solimonas sp.]